MNILYIAYSCDPYKGSEDKIGWNVPVASAKDGNNVFVITKEEQRNSVERWLSEHKIDGITFFFIDIPSVYKRIFKGFLYSGRLNIWNRKAYPLAKKICYNNKIDIIHQITPIEFRAIGNYGRIPNSKFVCGPLGGGEQLPFQLRDYAKAHRVIEFIRNIVNKWYRHRLFVSHKLESCDYLMFANKETKDFICGNELSVPNEVFFDNGLSNSEIKEV